MDSAELDSLAGRIRQVPLAHDPDRGASVLAPLDPSLRTGAVRDLLHGAAGSSPHLARLIGRHGEWLTTAMATAPEGALEDLLSPLRAPYGTQTALATDLRIAKARAALLIALADLSGAWPLADVTRALTRLADTACQAAASYLLTREAEAGRLPDTVRDGTGYILLAMGKMGAHELNYSSDIDLIALFDDAAFDGADVLEARARFVHVTRQLVKLLSDNANGGYVFRTDLRLRPSPSTTPVCMAVSAAERYYESVGRTWERAAHIKARALIDTVAGDQYLADLAPFIWRRHLDFAAVDDIQEMLRKIRDQRAQFTVGALPGHDLKLGPGGIREIEFFAQTRQLIMGGRAPGLRKTGTLAALRALQQAGVIDADIRETLTGAYTHLRTVEHRLQMIEDAQTHTIPSGEDARDRLAALSGFDDRAAFEGALVETLARVNRTTRDFFDDGAAEETPTRIIETEEALAEAGFQRPADAMRQIERWEQGRIAATRSERAQALFEQLLPQILQRLAGGADPDQALIRFDRFLSGLPAGVQVFSLFAKNRPLLDLIVSISAAAPKLARYLGRHAKALDALLDRDFWEPLPDAAALTADLADVLAAEDDYERVLDAARRWASEHWFRAGVHVLRRISDPAEAGHAFTAMAEACIAALLPHVIADFATRHGPPPGQGLAVLAMGKLGTCEMTAGSDLDLIVIYDADGAEMSEGPRPLAAQVYFPRLTQALVSALTAPTAEGALYEVDMRLRPSGRKGPVAVSLSAFASYQREKAWVWEHLALTRARPIAGPDRLRVAITGIVADALAARINAPEVRIDATDMRRRLSQANAQHRNNPWSLKHAAGGMMDIEFLAQTGTLLLGLPQHRGAGEQIPKLADAGWITSDEAIALADALMLQTRLQQIERVALEASADPATMGAELVDVLTSAAEVKDIDALTTCLTRYQAAAAAVCDRLLPVDDAEPPDGT